MMKTPPPLVSLRVKRRNARQIRRRATLNLALALGVHHALRRQDICCDETPPSIVQRNEMTLYFKLLEDKVIQEFLRMDCCYKLSDKYLLAMTFIYFKRARFTLAEYTRKNFFIALYLANTMEEDEEEQKYEIFPWALGRNWRNNFRRFLVQRDRLWARIEYRAVVSRCCCEQVIAIVSSHSAWQRKRSNLHSGAQRQYGDISCVPRGPSASPVPCSLCNHGNRLLHTPSSSRVFPAHPQPFTFSLNLEVTPPKAADRKSKESPAHHPCSFWPDEFLSRCHSKAVFRNSPVI
ncbi:speedy protein A [Pholidichthys leucotaenia]